MDFWSKVKAQGTQMDSDVLRWTQMHWLDLLRDVKGHSDFGYSYFIIISGYASRLNNCCGVWFRNEIQPVLPYSPNMVFSLYVKSRCQHPQISVLMDGAEGTPSSSSLGSLREPVDCPWDMSDPIMVRWLNLFLGCPWFSADDA